MSEVRVYKGEVPVRIEESPFAGYQPASRGWGPFSAMVHPGDPRDTTPDVGGRMDEATKEWFDSLKVGDEVIVTHTTSIARRMKITQVTHRTKTKVTVSGYEWRWLAKKGACAGSDSAVHLLPVTDQRRKCIRMQQSLRALQLSGTSMAFELRPADVTPNVEAAYEAFLATTEVLAAKIRALGAAIQEARAQAREGSLKV